MHMADDVQNGIISILALESRKLVCMGLCLLLEKSPLLQMLAANVKSQTENRIFNGFSVLGSANRANGRHIKINILERDNSSVRLFIPFSCQLEHEMHLFRVSKNTGWRPSLWLCPPKNKFHGFRGQSDAAIAAFGCLMASRRKSHHFQFNLIRRDPHDQPYRFC